MAWWSGRGPIGRRCVIGLVAILAGACARASDRLTDIPPGASAKGVLREPVRWVHHVHGPPGASEPAAPLADGGCIVVAPPGRWVVRPSEAARRRLSTRGGLLDVEPTPCVGVAEFVPGPELDHSRRVVVDGEVVHALSIQGTLRRALSPRAPFEVVPTPTALVDVGASRGALFGVGVDGRVSRDQPALLVERDVALPVCTEEQRRRQPWVPVALARDGARGRIEIEGAFGSARLRATVPVVYGVEPSCVAAWSTEACDAKMDASPQVTLTGDLRSGVAMVPHGPGQGHQRFRLSCAPP